MGVASRISALLLAGFIIGISVGTSFGEEGSFDFLLQEYLSGKTRSFKDILTAKANILLVTETNCYSCIKEIQSLDMIRAKYRGDISVSAAFLDRDGYARVKRYADYYKFDIDNLLIDETSSVGKGLKVTFVPTMFIFDRKGNQILRKEGFADGDESTIIAAIDDVLYSGRARATPRQEIQTTAGITSTSAPSLKKTTGCASTI